MDAFRSAPHATDSSMPHHRQPQHRASKHAVQSQRDTSQPEQRKTAYKNQNTSEKLPGFKAFLTKPTQHHTSDINIEGVSEVAENAFDVDCRSCDIDMAESVMPLQDPNLEHDEELLHEQEVEMETIAQFAQLEPQSLEQSSMAGVMHTIAAQQQQTSMLVGEFRDQNTGFVNMGQGAAQAHSQRFFQHRIHESNESHGKITSDADAEGRINPAFMSLAKISGTRDLYHQTAHVTLTGGVFRQFEREVAAQELEPIEAKPELMMLKSSNSVARVMPAAVNTFGSQVDVARHISEQLTAAVRQTDQGRTEITLSPEGLGRIRLTITQAESGAVVSLLVENDDTEALLKRHMDELAQEFSREGFEGSHFLFEQADAELLGEEQGEAEGVVEHYVMLENTKNRTSQSENKNGLDIKL